MEFSNPDDMLAQFAAFTPPPNPFAPGVYQTWELACSPDATSDDLHPLMVSQLPIIRRRLAENPRLPRADLVRLLHDKNARVRAAAEATVQAMSQHEQLEVRILLDDLMDSAA